MVKPVGQKQERHEPSSSYSESPKYKGVRKRKWGKWVSEIRLPNSRERIWLGSYDSAEKAARAFDAALFCLRGRTAKFNFPDNPPEIVNGRSLTPAEIQVAAARFANSEAPVEKHSGRVESSEHSSSSTTGSLHAVESPSPSVSDGVAQVDSELTEPTLDRDFLDLFSTLGSESNVPDYGIFPGFDDFSSDFLVPPLHSCLDYGEENLNFDGFSSQESFLWNF